MGKKQSCFEKRKKKYLLLNFVIPGIAHIYFKDYKLFLVVFFSSVFFLSGAIYYAYLFVKPLINYSKNPHPELFQLNYNILIYISIFLLIFNIIYFFSLRIIIKKIDKEGENYDF